MKQNPKEKLILERFKIQEKVQIEQQLINKQTFIIKNIYSNQKCILKIQPSVQLQSKTRNILHQASFFQTMQGHIGIPLMIWSGQDSQSLLLIIEQLGLNLQNQMQSLKQKKMRVKDVCMIGIKLLEIIQNLHERGFIHRNLTPFSLYFGKGPKCFSLYFSQLIYSRKYLNKKNDSHIQEKKVNKVDRVNPFQSLYVLNQTQGSRRDDLISICYIMIYLLKGSLPWSKKWKEYNNYKNSCKFKKDQIQLKQLQNKKNQILEFIKKQMTQTTSQKLCASLPNEFYQILKLSYQLGYKEKPEYTKYKMILKKLLIKSNQKNDDVFEWIQNAQINANHLQLSEVIPKIKTLQDLEIQDIVYVPFQRDVDIDLLQIQKGEKQDNKHYLNSLKFKSNRSNHRHCQII